MATLVQMMTKEFECQRSAHRHPKAVQCRVQLVLKSTRWVRNLSQSSVKCQFNAKTHQLATYMPRLQVLLTPGFTGLSLLITRHREDAVAHNRVTDVINKRKVPLCGFFLWVGRTECECWNLSRSVRTVTLP